MTAKSETGIITPVGDQIFQKISSELTGRKQTLDDLGLVKVVLTYFDQGYQHVVVRLVQHGTLDKIVNILEDEAIA
jgi:hypothetical protein